MNLSPRLKPVIITAAVFLPLLAVLCFFCFNTRREALTPSEIMNKKDWNREELTGALSRTFMAQADKRRRRKVVEGEEGKPPRISIFQIPTNISPALCAFMGRPAGSQESRSNVTKYITNYVKEKNLKNKHDINGDAALLKLLNLKKEDKLTYFNLQKYLNIHYIKTEKPAVASA